MQSRCSAHCITLRPSHRLELLMDVDAVRHQRSRAQIIFSLIMSEGNEVFPIVRPESPGPSCVSMKSNKSMGLPVTFSSVEKQRVKKRQRPASPVPSYVSMESDKSMGLPVTFTNAEMRSSDQREKRQRSETSASSCVSMENDKSMGLPVTFRTGEMMFPEQGEQSGFTGKRPKEEIVEITENSQRVKEKHKVTLKNKYKSISENVAQSENLPLNQIYTELYITEGETECVNTEHEVWQIENVSRRHTYQDNPVNCNDIFQPLLGQNQPIRTVLMKGVAGIGKTFSVQKFILSWAEKETNQDIDFLLVLPFRALNLIQDSHHSLCDILNVFHPELKELDENDSNNKMMFILDGLDESRLPLDFHANKTLSDMKEKSTVDVLVTNLIRGHLFPSALIWITSRPAAANQIPPEFVDQVIEIRGFSDPQKEEYFKKRFSDKNISDKMITHMKSSRSLHIMCHIPIFCWISATVLVQKFKEPGTVEVPQTLTEMITHFVLILTNLKNQKYQGSNETEPRKFLESDKHFLFNLGKLAFENLENGNLLFYEEDLRRYGFNITEASVYSGVCTEILKVESVLHQKKVYCFVHLLIQEFFAALYVFQSFTTRNVEQLKSFFEEKSKSYRLFSRASTPSIGELPLHEFLKAAVDKALESKNGHLDLFLRFLLGISVESNQKLLSGLLTQTENSSEISKKVVTYLITVRRPNLSPDRCLNIFHCMIEMRDDSVHKDIQEYLKSKERPVNELSPAHCSVLAHMLLMSGEEMEEVDLKNYNTSPAGCSRLLPAVRCCRKALLSDCKLTERSCETLASALQMSNSHLRDLDLSNNDLKDSGVKLLSDGLKSPQCRLEILRLSGCLVTEEGCASLVSALRSNPSHLKELDLSYNNPGESGVTLLSAGLEDPTWRLKKLNVSYGGVYRLKSGLNKYACDLTLDLNTAHRELSLSENNRKVTGVGVEQPYPDHPDRFHSVRQLLCTEGLNERSYWEADIIGSADIGMTYRQVTRNRTGYECKLGHNEKSWSLTCSNKGYAVQHSQLIKSIPAPPSLQRRVGVYLDWQAGTLSFYRVSDLQHKSLLYTFPSKFTEPLYPAFRVIGPSSVSLIDVG